MQKPISNVAHDAAFRQRGLHRQIIDGYGNFSLMLSQESLLYEVFG